MKMDVENRIYCDWDLLRFLTEENLQGENKGKTLSVIVEEKDIELMIFLQQMLNEEYEVNIYTDSTNFDHYEFKTFKEALYFIDTLAYEHPEYTERPVQRIVRTQH